MENKTKETFFFMINMKRNYPLKKSALTIKQELVWVTPYQKYSSIKLFVFLKYHLHVVHFINFYFYLHQVSIAILCEVNTVHM